MRASKPRVRYSVLLVTCIAMTACGGSSTQHQEQAGNKSSLLVDDQGQFDTDSRQLFISDEGTQKKTITQCFCDSLYRSTLLFYHFLDQNAVLLVAFDNTVASFPASGVLHLFSQSNDQNDISQWINNQHSDGLFVNPAEPVASLELESGAIAVTSSAYAESIAGYNGDEYERHQIEFTVANHLEPSSFFLNGFSDRTEVYLQTRAVTLAE